jgi:hypothetical protein
VFLGGGRGFGLTWLRDVIWLGLLCVISVPVSWYLFKLDADELDQYVRQKSQMSCRQSF